jgi:ABC-type uncharacterized transport system substrate-binding protein
MNRRQFITLLGGAAAVWPIAARAQQPAMPVIGFLSSFSSDSNVRFIAAFRRGLNESGYIEGRNVALGFRWADNFYDRLPILAAELVALGSNVIVAAGGGVAALAARNVTSTIPILFINGNDPVKLGLVASLSRPGGNLTGVSFFGNELGSKRLELLREIMANDGNVGYLFNPNNPNASIDTPEMEAAARRLGTMLLVLPARTQSEIDAAFDIMVQRRTKAVLIASDPFFLTCRDQLIKLAIQHTIAGSYAQREFIEAGGLVSYGTSLPAAYHQIGVYASRILAGAKAAELPVIQPTKFDLAINMKAARALGIEVSPTLLARADEVIE